MKSNHLQPYIKFVFISFSVIFQSLSFMFSKFAAQNIESNNMIEYLINPYYIVSIGCLVLQAFFWQKTLEYMELSKAYPYTGLIYILILLYTYFIFDEEIYFNNIVGTMVILLGIYIINFGEDC